LEPARCDSSARLRSAVLDLPSGSVDPPEIALTMIQNSRSAP